jgi:hypothetical protein
MKKTPIFIIILSLTLTLVCTFSACKKANEIEISEENLTTCDAINCENIFTLSSDIDSNFLPQATGNYKVFTALKTYSGSQTNIFILAPKSGNSFILRNSDIKNGLVRMQYISMGYPAGFKPVGGEVKGKNLLPDQNLDQSKWLIEAKIYLAADLNEKGDQKLKDTLYLKQYFYPNFVFD